VQPLFGNKLLSRLVANLPSQLVTLQQRYRYQISKTTCLENFNKVGVANLTSQSPHGPTHLKVQGPSVCAFFILAEIQRSLSNLSG